MKLRKTITLIMCVLLVTALFAGCNPKVDNNVSPTDVPETSATPSETPEPTPEEPTSNIDFSAAFAAHSPDEVMFTLGEGGQLPVTWDLLFYFMSYATTEIETNLGLITDWNTQIDDDDEDTYSDYVMNSSIDNIIMYKAIEYGAAQLGVTLTDEQLTDLETQTAAMKEQLGGEEGFQAYLDENHLTENVLDYAFTTTYLFDDVQTALYGAGGANVSDADVQQYADVNSLIAAKHILFLTVDDSGAALPDDEIAAIKTKAEGVLAELKAYNGSDFDEFFDEKVTEYTEDTGIQSFPDGYIFGPGDMVPEFEEATKSLAVGGMSDLVTTTYGFHIIHRIPINYDGLMMSADGYSAPETLRATAAYAMYVEQLTTWETVLKESRADTDAFASFDLVKTFTFLQ
jgi:hypothetical protein